MWLIPFLVDLVICFFFIEKLQSIWFTFPLINILNIYRPDFIVQWSIWYLWSDQISGILSVTHIWLIFCHLEKTIKPSAWLWSTAHGIFYDDSYETQNKTWELPKALNFYLISQWAWWHVYWWWVFHAVR